MEKVEVRVFEHGRDQGQGLAGWGDAGRGSESAGWWVWRGAVGVEMGSAHRSWAAVPGMVLEGGVDLDRATRCPVDVDRDGSDASQQPLCEDVEHRGMNILRQQSNTRRMRWCSGTGDHAFDMGVRTQPHT